MAQSGPAGLLFSDRDDTTEVIPIIDRPPTTYPTPDGKGTMLPPPEDRVALEMKIIKFTPTIARVSVNWHGPIVLGEIKELIHLAHNLETLELFTAKVDTREKPSDGVIFGYDDTIINDMEILWATGGESEPNIYTLMGSNVVPRGSEFSRYPVSWKGPLVIGNINKVYDDMRHSINEQQYIRNFVMRYDEQDSFVDTNGDLSLEFLDIGLTDEWSGKETVSLH